MSSELYEEHLREVEFDNHISCLEQERELLETKGE